VLFRQFVDDDLGCASYLIGDTESGEALVVDPAFAIEPYLEEAARQRVRITRVLETHTHADHVSGHGRFALEQSATVLIHRAAEPEFVFEPLDDGMTIELGPVAVGVMHTPGHRPEHCCFTVTDRARGDDPWLVLTGDSLLVGDAARPDLAVAAQEGAEGMFHSLRRLAELSDGVEIYPGHVAGSLCGAGVSSKPSSTIGFERRFNSALRFSDVHDYVAEVVARKAPRPANMERIVQLNCGPFVAVQPPLERLDSTERLTVLDVRSAHDFAAGHVEGALNVPVSGSSFATKAGFVLLPDEGIAIHAGDAAEAEHAARGLRSVGFLELAGYVIDPPTPARLEPVELDELERLLEGGEVEVVDVRETDERDDGYIPGSRHIPYRLLREVSNDLRGDRPIVTICSSGNRASIAASVLVAAGVEARPVLGAGVADWNDTVAFRRCGN
jgi:hydroxyacylglutathione hydrolase